MTDRSRVEYEETPGAWGHVARIRVSAPNGVRHLGLDVTELRSLTVHLDGNSFVISEPELRLVLQHLAAALRV